MTASIETGMIVEKKVFELERFTTANGADLKSVRIGWESYGELNADASNAVLITHFFSATSHAAGRYSPADELPGYWDALIGPGKAIDTDRYFVLSSDTLVNINVNDPKVTTTGPASLDPDTGKPYGMSFPVVSIRDFVNVQKALVESLGISKLKAVIGPSMGALQAYEWATAYPEIGGADRSRHRRRGRRPVPDRVARHLGAADPPGPQLARWRLLRRGTADGGCQACPEDHHAARQSGGMGGRVRQGTRSTGEISGGCARQRVQDRGVHRSGLRVASARRRCQHAALYGAGQSTRRG